MKGSSRRRTDAGPGMRRLAARARMALLLVSMLAGSVRAAEFGKRLPGVAPGGVRVPVADVALRQPRGRLEGLVAGGNNALPGSLGGIKVVLRRRGRVVAETRTDREGRFAVSDLAPGLILVEVHTAAGTRRRFYRAWAPASAPPASALRVLFPAEPVLVRGKGPLGPAIPDAAWVAGVVAGAIAVPFIYDSISDSHKPPASP